MGSYFIQEGRKLALHVREDEVIQNVLNFSPNARMKGFGVPYIERSYNSLPFCLVEELQLNFIITSNAMS